MAVGKYRSRLLPEGALIEFIPSGAYVKVCAVDPVSREEVAIVGDPRSGSKRLSEEAVKKLEYVLRKKLTAQTGVAQPNSVRQDQNPVTRGKRSEPPSGWDF